VRPVDDIARLGALARRLQRDERGQALPIVLVLVLVLFLLGSALAMHTSLALRTTAANEGEANDLYAADAGVELGIWWNRQGLAGNPPAITLNGNSVATTVSTVAGGGGGSGPGWLQWGYNGRSWAVSGGPGPAAYAARWITFPTVPQGATLASPTVASDGFVYVGASDGLRAYRPDGQLAWSFLSASQSPVLGAFIGSPAITTIGTQRAIVVATDGAAASASTVFGLLENAAQTGVSVRWSYTLGSGAGIGFVGGAKLNASGTRAFVGARNGTLYAFDTTATGGVSPLWSAAAGGSVTVPPVLNATETRVYSATATGILRAFDTTSGAQAWTRTVAAGAVLSAPVFRDTGSRQHLYVATGTNRTVRAIRDNGPTSVQDWSVALPADAFSAPVLRSVGAQNFLYVAADDGSVRKIEDLNTSGPVRWTHAATASRIRSSLGMESGGLLYVGDDGGRIIAITDGGTSASTAWSQALGLGAVASELVVGTDRDLYAVAGSGRLVAVGCTPPAAMVTVTATAGAATAATTYCDSGSAAPILLTWAVTR